jgi:ABC-type glycerol-3-phosphate transport system substrate-binding protein
VHLSETCEEDQPLLITNVETTPSTTQDVSVTETIHEHLEEKDLLPKQHLVDAGYVDARGLAESQSEYGVDLYGPARPDPSWQARAGEGFDLSDVYPGTVDVLSREGKTWAIPFGADVVVMYYNKDLFDEYNVPYPQIGWTWEDFLERAVALRDPDAFVFGYGPPPDAGDTMFFIYQHGGRLFEDPEIATRATFDDPLTIEALEWYARLVHDYDAAPSLNQASRVWGEGSYSIYEGIRLGKVGMWMGELSERGGLTWPVKWKMEWGMVPLPSDAQSWTIAVVEGYAISSGTEHHDACWEWIAWLSEQEPYRLMPARRSLAESSAYEDRVGAEVAAVARASMEHAFVLTLPADLDQHEGAVETFEDALEDILQGRKTPLEAMTEAQQKAGK